MIPTFLHMPFVGSYVWWPNFYRCFTFESIVLTGDTQLMANHKVLSYVYLVLGLPHGLGFHFD